jgi:tetratricopeptide (TPR) repeat protein
MPSDDQHNPSDSARKQLLEEIRKRAEEAEMNRIEEEDRSRTGRTDADRLKTKAPAPFPVPASESPAAGNKAATEQKILVLRERLQSALERGKSEKAAELFSELNKIIPDDPALAEFRVKLRALQEERAKAREQTRPVSPAAIPPRRVPQPPPAPVSPVAPAAPPPAPPPVGAPPSARTPQSTRAPQPAPQAPPPLSPADERAEREKRRRKMVDMLEAANNYYQQEKYDKALVYISEVLSLDPSHEEGASLRAQILKARDLEEQIKMEEEERRAKEHEAGGPVPRPKEEAPPSSGRPTDFWGSSLSQKLESDYDLVPEEKGPVGPPPLPLGQRVVNRLSQVHIPLKPVLTITAVLVLGTAAWFVVEAIRNSVSPARYSLLVLPPATGGDTTIVYAAEGFEGDIIAEAARLADVRVINPATSNAFGASVAPPGRIARALGANYVLSWSMARAEGSYTLHFTLADTLSNGSLWSQQYHVSARELPSLRPEIIRGIAKGMGVKAVTADGGALSGTSTNNEAAYDLYLKGRSLLSYGDNFAPEDAVGLFDQAGKLDPDFAEVHSAAAWAHMLAYETSVEMQQSHVAQAVTEVQRALNAGLRNSETFRAWGLAEEFRGSYDKAITRFEQAVAIAPSDAESQRRLAVAYAAKGRIDDAVKAAQRSVSDDQGNITAHTLLGQVEQFKAIHELDNRDDYRAALKAYDQGLRLARDRSDYGSGLYVEVLLHLQQTDRVMDLLLDRTARMRDSYVDYYKLGRVQQSAGRPIAEWQTSFVRARDILTARIAAQPDDALAQAYLALVYTRLGTFKDAIAASGRAQIAAPGDDDVLYLTSRMYVLQKDRKQALEFLGKALSKKFNLGAVLDMDYFNVQSDPEFLAALKQQ